MLASHLHLPTAAWGGHMGHFLLSMLILSSSTPLGNMASTSAELNSKFLMQDRPHKSFQGAIPAYVMPRCNHSLKSSRSGRLLRRNRLVMLEHPVRDVAMKWPDFRRLL